MTVTIDGPVAPRLACLSVSFTELRWQVPPMERRMFCFPGIVDHTEGYLADVVKKAKALGLWLGKHGLRRRLLYLATYANRRGCMYDRKQHLGGTQCHIYKDWSPLSFSFVIKRKDLNDAWVFWFNGGMIYQGPELPADGSFPSLTVSLSNFTGWGIHT